jgi:hydrogenase 3 maturation protease
MADLVVMCIGNRDGGDDAVGPFIADLLKREHLNFVVLDGGVSPENYTSVVKRHHPKTLVLIDAADMMLAAGEMRVVPKEKIGTMHLSTHGMSLALLIEFLANDIAEIIVIGIQPQSMNGALSPAVRKSAEQLRELMKKKRFRQIPVL